MSRYIAEYILKSEFACDHCNKLPHDMNDWRYEEIFDAFHLIRTQYGRPIPISSGYRCPVHNVAEGGGEYSVHIFGLALDCDVQSDSQVRDLEGIVEHFLPHLRMGVYTGQKTFIHIDVGYTIEPKMSEHWRQGARWHIN